MINQQKSLNFDLFFKTTPHPVVIINPKGEILYFNKATKYMIPYLNLKNFRNHNFAEILQLDEKNKNLIPFLKNKIDKLRNGNTNTTFQIKLHIKENQILRLKISASNIDLDGNSYIKLLIFKGSRFNDSKSSFEQLYHTLFNQSSNAIFLVNMDKIIADCNPMAEKITGFTKQELIGADYSKLLIFSESQKLKLLERYKKLMNGESVSPIELKIKNKDGKTMWGIIQSSLIEYDDALYIYIIIQNKTDIRKSQKNYKTLLNLLPDIIFEADLELNLTFANKIAFKKFKYSEEDFHNGLTILQMVDETYHERVEKSLINLFNGEKTKPTDYLMRKSNGETFWARLHSRPRLENNHVVGIIGTLQDITPIKEQEKRLKESEKKFRKLGEKIPLSIIIIQDYKIVYSNHKFGLGLGFSREEIDKMTLQDFFSFIHPQDREFVRNQLTIKQEGKENAIPNYEFRFRTKDGELRWREIYTQNIIINQKPAELIIFIDITEKKKAQTLVKEENQKLKELDNMRREFINRASHELKTPLTSIIGAIQLLYKNYLSDLNQEVLELLHVAQKGSKRLKHLIDNLLDTSRIESSKLYLEYRQVDLILLLKKCISDMYFLLKERQIELKLNFPEKSLIKLDKLRIEQVIFNLISNAIKNTPKGGYIYIDFKDNKNNIEFSIRDTGVGITEKEMKKLFDKFSKIERYGQGLDINPEGSGLGLFITKEIIDAHKGKIWVESKGRNKGAVFRFTLPKKKG